MSGIFSQIHDISEFVKLGREGLELIKGAIPLLPSGNARKELEKKLADAEAALSRSDVKLAKELGMKLCDCTFPPQIMLWRETERSHVCPRAECGRRTNDLLPKDTILTPTKEISAPATGVACPYCGAATALLSERDHEHFAFAGWKSHTLKCVVCKKQTTRQWKPGDGYNIK
jgi:ssDNA-binding Zn-finger/Zn-ribbon topoisomerase 1